MGGVFSMFKISTIKRVIALALAATLCAGLLAGCSGGGYKKPLDTLIKATKTGKSDLIFDLALPDFLNEKVLDEPDGKKALRDAKKELDEMFEDGKENLKDRFGKNWKMTYEIDYAARYEKDELIDLAEDWDDRYGPFEKTPKFQDAYDLEVEFTYKGSKSDSTRNFDMTLIKYKGKWYIDPENLDEMGLLYLYDLGLY
jgi:hypothetical protein